MPNFFFSAETREKALLELSQKREHVDNLAPMLWHSFGTISALLQEIVSVYFAIDPPTLSGMAFTFGSLLDNEVPMRTEIFR